MPSRSPEIGPAIRDSADPRGEAIALVEALVTRCGIGFRGDGPPFWHEGGRNKPPQSAAEARRSRRNLINLLRRSHDNLGELRDLADRLRTCSLTEPCRSGACAVCWRALRRLLVHASRPLFGVADRYAFVTCVSDDDRVICGQPLEIDTITAAERRIMEIAVPARMRVFGAIDISANEHRHDRFPRHYQAHPHLISDRQAFEARRAEFEQRYRASPTIRQPVRAKPYDGRRRLIAYILDAPTEKRISREQARRLYGKRGSRTSAKPLNSQQRVALARLLDRAGIEARILLYGYELRTDGEDVWLATVSRQRADEILAVRRRAAARRLWEQTCRDRRRAREQLERERYGPTLWRDRDPGAERWLDLGTES